jgi:hypothetical protein
MRLTFIVLLVGLLGIGTISAQENKPLVMPVAGAAGPSTWMLGQPYGNTTGAYNFGRAWYSAGQGLHFGIDLSMPCGTELVAVADGEVLFVDDLSFGSAPHNLLLRHAQAGVTSLYGHLLQRPNLIPGQLVQQGEVIALSGDPDLTCISRPHLHLELRSLDYRTTYNPVDYIQAPWHTLATIGSFGYPLFQQDMDNARRWLNLDDQPDVSFGGMILNQYAATWPPARDVQPPVNAPLRRELLPEPAGTWHLRRIGYDGCCANVWWHPTNADLLYTVDGNEGQRASIMEWSAASGTPTSLTSPAPPPLLSPDGTHQIIPGDQMTIRRADDAEWLVNTPTGAISTDNSRLLWEVRSDMVTPGEPAAMTDFWVSDVSGENARVIVSQSGGSAQWLDEARVLIQTPVPEERATTLSVFNTRDNSSFTLGTWKWMRGLSVAPGGGRLLFYVNFQEDAAENSIYSIATQAGAAVEKLPWFGGWRWRDGDSVYYIPFDTTTEQHTLAYYHLPSGANRALTDPAAMPFTVANGLWSVSADGRRIVFFNALDRTMWLLEEQ